MKEYTFEVSRTLVYWEQITVEAESEKEARDLAKNLFDIDAANLDESGIDLRLLKVGQ